jgi:hypothetical protein
MSNFKLNLPTDIPWKRKCVSEDMLDNKLCDAKSPLRWRSSIVVFEYTPEDEFQSYEGMTISYLKVTCSITGYQEDPKEIGLNYRGLRSYWKDQPGIDNYLDVLQKYYACYGAVLEVTVGAEDPKTSLGNFPYFLDFEPKKRELYELASDTNEKLSRSVESLNLTKSAGSTQSTEVFDIDMGGGGFGAQASFAGTGGGFNYSAPSGQWGTKRMNADESMSARTSDVGQEKRETFSHTTQISQLYHQLDSYHIGTNRALFFILPRPHTIETEHTFVNGPRNIEGIQEFMFVVARPKAVEDICVEVYLETGHIGKVPTFETETRQDSISLTIVENFDGKSGDALDRNNDDNTEDRAKEGQTLYTVPPGFKIVSVGPIIRNVDRRVVDCKFIEQDATHAVLWGRVSAHFQDDFGDNQVYDAKLDASATIFLEAVTPVATGSKDTLFITGRKLCCCPNSRLVKFREGIVYEKVLDYNRLQVATDRRKVSNGRMSIMTANRIGDEVKSSIINSRTDSENRYETAINLTQANFTNKALASLIRDTHKETLGSSRSIPEKIKKKLSALNPNVKISEIINMPLQMQKDIFSLSENEVKELRDSINGSNNKDFDPKDAWLSERQQGKLFTKDKGRNNKK